MRIGSSRRMMIREYLSYWSFKYIWIKNMSVFIFFAGMLWWKICVTCCILIHRRRPYILVTNLNIMENRYVHIVETFFEKQRWLTHWGFLWFEMLGIKSWYRQQRKVIEIVFKIKIRLLIKNHQPLGPKTWAVTNSTHFWSGYWLVVKSGSLTVKTRKRSQSEGSIQARIDGQVGFVVCLVRFVKLLIRTFTV